MFFLHLLEVLPPLPLPPPLSLSNRYLADQYCTLLVSEVNVIVTYFPLQNLSQTISNVGPNYETDSNSFIIYSSVSYCLNLSTSVLTEETGLNIFDLVSLLNVSVTRIPNSPSVNLLTSWSVSIPDTSVSVATYETMLSTCVTSGRYTAFMQSAAAVTPNASALLQASSSAVIFGKESDFHLVLLHV